MGRSNDASEVLARGPARREPPPESSTSSTPRSNWFSKYSNESRTSVARSSTAGVDRRADALRLVAGAALQRLGLAGSLRPRRFAMAEVKASPPAWISRVKSEAPGAQHVDARLAGAHVDQRADLRPLASGPRRTASSKALPSANTSTSTISGCRPDAGEDAQLLVDQRALARHEEHAHLVRARPRRGPGASKGWQSRTTSSTSNGMYLSAS